MIHWKNVKEYNICFDNGNEKGDIGVITQMSLLVFRRNWHWKRRTKRQQFKRKGVKQ